MLLVSGMLESCLQSKAKGSQVLATPRISVRYNAPTKTQHAQR